MKLIIVNIPFNDWKSILYSNRHIMCIKEDYIDKFTSNEYRIVPICVGDYLKYNHLENNIFKNNINSIEILNNKSKFGKFGLENFPDNIPTIYYYNFDRETFLGNTDDNLKNNKMIIKPNIGFGGGGIKIINHFIPNMKEHIIQKYINHTEYIVGHFLVLNGMIRHKVYFISSHRYNDGIKHGRIINYVSSDTITTDDSIFNNIFNILNYSGFADADFIIVNGKIIIFEINPRPGGSLIFNSQYLNIFLEKLTQI